MIGPLVARARRKAERSRPKGKRGRRRGWTEEQLAEAIRTCDNWKAVAERLGMKKSASGYLRRSASALGLDFSHFNFQQFTDLQDRADGFEDVEPVHLHVSGEGGAEQSYRDLQLARFVLVDVDLPPETPASMIDVIPGMSDVPLRGSVPETWRGKRQHHRLDRLAHPRKAR